MVGWGLPDISHIQRQSSMWMDFHGHLEGHTCPAGAEAVGLMTQLLRGWQQLQQTKGPPRSRGPSTCPQQALGLHLCLPKVAQRDTVKVISADLRERHALGGGGDGMEWGGVTV